MDWSVLSVELNALKLLLNEVHDVCSNLHFASEVNGSAVFLLRVCWMTEFHRLCKQGLSRCCQWAALLSTNCDHPAVVFVSVIIAITALLCCRCQRRISCEQRRKKPRPSTMLALPKVQAKTKAGGIKALATKLLKSPHRYISFTIVQLPSGQ